MFAAGYLLSYFRKTDNLPIADLIIYITAPALLLKSISSRSFEVGEVFIIILTVVFTIFVGLLALKLIRKRLSLSKALYLPIAFMNTGFIGVPVIMLTYGQDGLSYAMIYDACLAILVFTLGVYIVSEKKDLSGFFKIPLVYSAILAVFLNISGIKIPYFIDTALSFLGNSTIPLALIMLGIRIEQTKIQSLTIPLFIAFMRAFLGLLCALIIINIFHLSGLLANVLLIMSIMPSAITGIVFCELHSKKEDCDVVASSIAASTIASFIYIPMLLYFIR